MSQNLMRRANKREYLINNNSGSIGLRSEENASVHVPTFRRSSGHVYTKK